MGHQTFEKLDSVYMKRYLLTLKYLLHQLREQIYPLLEYAQITDQTLRLLEAIFKKSF